MGDAFEVWETRRDKAVKPHYLCALSIMVGLHYREKTLGETKEFREGECNFDAWGYFR